MLADLDLLLIAAFCAADDLLPKARKNAKRIVTDAEVITLCVAQVIMGIPSDPRFLARRASDPGISSRRSRTAPASISVARRCRTRSKR
jgi:hypothetical protein